MGEAGEGRAVGAPGRRVRGVRWGPRPAGPDPRARAEKLQRGRCSPPWDDAGRLQRQRAFYMVAGGGGGRQAVVMALHVTAVADRQRRWPWPWPPTGVSSTTAAEYCKKKSDVLPMGEKPKIIWHLMLEF